MQHAKLNYRKAEVAILISDKNLRIRTISKIKRDTST
jgi:hypothetical protein